MAGLAGGMTWRQFAMLLAGLSVESRWHLALAVAEDRPRDGVVLEGKQIDAFLNSLATKG